MNCDIFYEFLPAGVKGGTVREQETERNTQERRQEHGGSDDGNLQYGRTSKR